jgi:threonine dehydrogenase-like Zn-dependent dehydrogenase
MATASRLLYTGKVSVAGMLDKRFRFADALEACSWLDRKPKGAVKVVLVYGDGTG